MFGELTMILGACLHAQLPLCPCPDPAADPWPLSKGLGMGKGQLCMQAALIIITKTGTPYH